MKGGGAGQGLWSVLYPPALLRRETEVDKEMVAVAAAGMAGSLLDTPVGSREGWPPAPLPLPQAVRGPRGRPRGWADPLAPGLILF